MRPLCCAVGPAPVLALALLVAMPARAGTVDSSACKRDLTAASAGVSETRARLKGLAKKTRAEEKCAAYRAQFLVVVKARAVFANCKTGPDRDDEVDRLDGTIEDLNGAIAESCSVQ
jgi:hypothetical protein